MFETIINREKTDLESRQQTCLAVMTTDERQTLDRLNAIETGLAKAKNDQLKGLLRLERAELRMSLAVLRRAKKNLLAEIETRSK